jgi:hypothetical protein
MTVFISTRCKFSMDLLKELEKCDYLKDTEVIDMDRYEPQSFPKFLKFLPTLVIDDTYIVGYSNIVDYMVDLENNRNKQGKESNTDSQLESDIQGHGDDTFASFDESWGEQLPSNSTDQSAQERTLSPDAYNKMLEQEIYERENLSNMLASQPQRPFSNPIVKE